MPEPVLTLLCDRLIARSKQAVVVARNGAGVKFYWRLSFGGRQSLARTGGLYPCDTCGHHRCPPANEPFGLNGAPPTPVTSARLAAKQNQRQALAYFACGL